MDHPRFGWQFKATRFEVKAPTSLIGIKRYLSSGLVQGLGEEYARRIVQIFGEETLEIIDKYPRRLLEVPGIGKARLAKIQQSWEENKTIRAIMVFLKSIGITTGLAMKIYRKYGEQTIPLLKANPYRLSDDLFQVGFRTADTIANEMGIQHDSPKRIQAFAHYYMRELTSQGHVYYPYAEFIQKCTLELGVTKTLVEDAITHLIQLKRFHKEQFIDSNMEVVYLHRMYIQEVELGILLHKRIQQQTTARSLFHFAPENLHKSIRELEKRFQITFASIQRQALQAATQERILIITGGPGTGKTTLIRSILELYATHSDLDPSAIFLAAPTGRAAKRLEETTQREASTIHRMLKFNPIGGKFHYSPGHYLPAKLVILDECSMIDQSLFHSLLNGLPPEAHLILVGDADQLPSVGPGNVLNDLIESNRIPTVRLNQIFRQEEHSLIKVNAHAINRGEVPSQPSSENILQDYYFIEKEEPEAIQETLLKIYFERIPTRFGFAPGTDIQILSPMRRGMLGVDTLNRIIQHRLLSSDSNAIGSDSRFHINDRVMQLRNNYQHDVYNGDIGKVVGLEPEEGAIRVLFDGHTVRYEKSELDELILAYAITIHKSQGSEFPAVCIPLHTQHYMMLQRQLIYTAITRAKQLVVLIGSRKALEMAVRNVTQEPRYTYLQQRLIQAEEHIS
jgi:exodeoxyribonuclease V alpha subunit